MAFSGRRRVVDRDCEKRISSFGISLGVLYQVAFKRLLFIDGIANQYEAIPGPDLVFETIYMILSSGNYSQPMLAA